MSIFNCFTSENGIITACVYILIHIAGFFLKIRMDALFLHSNVPFLTRKKSGRPGFRLAEKRQEQKKHKRMTRESSVNDKLKRQSNYKNIFFFQKPCFRGYLKDLMKVNNDLQGLFSLDTHLCSQRLSLVFLYLQLRFGEHQRRLVVFLFQKGRKKLI